MVTADKTFERIRRDGARAYHRHDPAIAPVDQGSPFDFAQRRNIQNKSYLEFHFPTDTPLVARLPLYENIEIKESKEANLVTYNPIGRNSALYAYTGASSRKLKISFALTLQHIQSMHEGAKVRFKPGDSADKTREQIKKLMKVGKSAPVGEVLHVEPNNWVKYVAWWVNLIRSSVMSNQSDTTQGPPTVRLTHGELYQNIPCICHSYDITYDKNAGMDVDSLLSRRILVNMDLEEFRAGDFGEYDRTAINTTTRDNVTGWESIIAYSTTDPGSDISAKMEAERDRLPPLPRPRGKPVRSPLDSPQ